MGGQCQRQKTKLKVDLKGSKKYWRQKAKKQPIDAKGWKLPIDLKGQKYTFTQKDQKLPVDENAKQLHIDAEIQNIYLKLI